MARTPKPWYWKSRKAWYVILDGKKIRLADTKAEATTRFHELMCKPRERIIASDSLLAIIDAFLDWCHRHRAPDTYEWYRQRLEEFAKRHPDLRAADLRPYHVQEWLDAMTVSSGTKRNYCRSVKRCMRWAKRQGHIDLNPIADLEQPKAGKRETVISDDEFRAILDCCNNDAFRDLLLITRETGCRPQESLRVEARHVDLAHQRWVFPESESKTDLRIVYLTDTALKITSRLIEQYPKGKLFRNSRGRAWTTDAVNCSFTAIQMRMGLAEMERKGIDVSEAAIKKLIPNLAPTAKIGGVIREKRPAEFRLEAKKKLRYKLAVEHAPKYSLYAIRHTWATNALKRGIDPLTVAILMGHRHPGTLVSHYQHLSLNPEHMLAQAKKAVS